MKIQDHILQQFPSLSPTLQAAARYVVDHPNEVIVASMRTLAERADALPATFVRLAQQLGYDGWAGLKAAFVADMGLHDQGYGQRAKSLLGRGRHGGLTQELQEALQRNQEASFAKSAPVLPKAAELLRKAGTVHVAGYRASAAVAYSLFYGLRLFRADVHLLDGAHGGLEWQLRAVGKGDAVVAVSFAPYSREALQVLEAARAAGARTLVLTDSPASPLALAADLTLLFDADSPSFFPSLTAAMAVTEALLELVVASAGPAVSAAMERAEQALFASGAYIQTPRKRPS